MRRFIASSSCWIDSFVAWISDIVECVQVLCNYGCSKRSGDLRIGFRDVAAMDLARVSSAVVQLCVESQF
jgi:hypothetical protein